LTKHGGGFSYLSLFAAISPNRMRQLLNITKALADANRLRMLLALQGAELCVCQVTELFGLAPSTVSKHLSILYQAGLVQARKDGRWMFYRLPGKEAPPVVRRALTWITGAGEEVPEVAADAARLKKVLTMDPVELCKRQTQRCKL
jgi:DNA-binding transcriptional ArsR family regulator